MHLRAPAILVSARSHGETGVVARLLTEEHGIVAAYVAGGRGRQMRPVVIPGNRVEADIRAKSESQLPFAKLELVESRGPWLSEPLPAAAIGWVTALSATALPERQAYPSLYDALGALLDAICHAPSARGWATGLASYETLLLRELGYGRGEKSLSALPEGAELSDILNFLAHSGRAIDQHVLAGRYYDVMAARERLIALLARIGE